MKLGLFGMPLHPPTRPMAESYEEDAAKVIHADEVGFDEVWVGEHMSCTTEPIASPASTTSPTSTTAATGS